MNRAWLCGVAAAAVGVVFPLIAGTSALGAQRAVGARTMYCWPVTGPEGRRWRCSARVPSDFAFFREGEFGPVFRNERESGTGSSAGTFGSAAGNGSAGTTSGL